MADYARAVGVEATYRASRKCRICSGTGIMSSRRSTDQVDPMIDICGCAVRRIMKELPDELTVDDGILCWKEGYSPKEKQAKLREALEADAANVRP